METFSLCFMMGGSVSSGRNNDELINHLVEAEFIRTILVQRVFRAVDRGLYFHESYKKNAYKDIAWRKDHLHLSAPCVYSVVLESLKLSPGLSFLNIGSGTGYFSTMAGLILGVYGVNHGIELHSDTVEFASDRLEGFLQTSIGVDYFDFCEPSFVVGNCLNLDSSCQQYDRVYCGAACPEEYEQHMKSLLKVGGILIIPLQEKLVKVTRTSETEWQSVKILSTCFTPLVLPDSSGETVNTVELSHKAPPQLQMICRSNVRSMIRDKINAEYPEYELHRKMKEKCHKKPVHHLVIPSYCAEGNPDAYQSASEVDYDSEDLEYSINSRLPSSMSVFLQDFFIRNRELKLLRGLQGQQPEHAALSSEDKNDKTPTETPSKWISIPASTFVVSSDESSNFADPPSLSTRSRKRRGSKRRCQDSKALPSTSSQSASEPQKKFKRSSTTIVRKKRGRKDNMAIQDKKVPTPKVSFSNLMIDRIKSLPLPPRLMKYLNYSRSKFPEIPESK